MPKVGVHAIILDESGHVLLVKRNYLDHDWIPPGGVMEDGESIPDAVKREVFEETGFEIEVGELVALGSRARTNDVIVVVAGKIIERKSHPVDADEISEAGFFALNELPQPMKPEAKKLLELYYSGKRGQLVVI